MKTATSYKSAPNSQPQPAPRPASRPEKTVYRVMVPSRRDGEDKTFWNRIGTAFENPGKNGQGPTISVKLNALPIGTDIVLFPDDGQGREPGSDDQLT